MSTNTGSTQAVGDVAQRGRTVPTDVQWAFVFWIVTLAAGVVEAALRAAAGEDLRVTDIAIRLTIYVIVGYIATRMRGGANWARVFLAVVVGGLGTLSLVIEPVTLLVAGNALGEALARASFLSFAIAAARAVHIVAVLIAVVLMFRPAANAYFGRSRSHARASARRAG